MPVGIQSDSINGKRQTAAETYVLKKRGQENLIGSCDSQSDLFCRVGFILPPHPKKNHIESIANHWSANQTGGVLKHSLDVSHHPLLPPEGCSVDVGSFLPMSWCSMPNNRRRRRATPAGGCRSLLLLPATAFS